MTQEEAKLIRTCICNGFEFFQKMQNDVIVTIGNEKFSFNRLCCIADEVMKASEKQIPKKFEIFNGQDCCPNCKSIFGSDETRKKLIHWEMDFCKYCGQALDWSESNA